jgi:hypothetical protein
MAQALSSPRSIVEIGLDVSHFSFTPCMAIIIFFIHSLHLPKMIVYCRNPTLAKCDDETHTPKVGDLESSGTPEFLEFDSKAQNTSYWGVLGVIGKFLKRRCPKWPRIGHLDTCSPSYGQKKGWESNWQFDSRPLKVKNRPLPNIRF